MTSVQVQRYRIAIWLLALYALFVSSILVGRRKSATEPVRLTEVAAGEAHALHQGPLRDSEEASGLQITIWTDYQCPFCRKLEAALDSSKVLQDRRASVTIRHYPLEFHERARQLAELAICADREQSFPILHRTLFAIQKSLDTLSDRDVLNIAGLDLEVREAVLSCLTERAAAEQIASDIADANKLGIEGTPLMLFGRTLVRGSISAAEIDLLANAIATKNQND